MKRSSFIWNETHPLSFSDKPAECWAWINVLGELLWGEKDLGLEFSLNHIGVIDA